MRKIRVNILTIILIALNFINCQETVSPDDKLFDSHKLPLLSLEKIDRFWDNDSIKNISNYMGATFDSHSEFINGTNYSGSKKMIAVSVFQSQSGAIGAMNERINNVASLIITGTDHKLFPEQWWYSEGISNAIFVNKWNTIIEIVYFNSEYKAIETELKETAVEIAQRIDLLSY